MTKPAARPEPPDDHAIPPGAGSTLDALIKSSEEKHPDKSGFHLVDQGPEAFAIRGRSALHAGRSIDVQAYTWDADVSGSYLAHQLLEAADRGVRVRLLVDDMDAREKNACFAGLDAHPNIEVRLFNPFSTRRGTLRLWAETVARFRRINRRMHNKAWIVDNRLAIVGGRNLGDPYFGAGGEINFVDIDLAMMGPITWKVSSSFDRYWNARATVPLQSLDPKSVHSAALERVRSRLADQAAEAEKTSRLVGKLGTDESLGKLVTGDRPAEWTVDWSFVSDDPDKVYRPSDSRRQSRMTRAIMERTKSAQQSITLVSPYFIPGRRGSRVLIDAARRGVRVRVLTNSLVANDIAAVHGGYSRWRKKLLIGGVELWELKPLPDRHVRTRLLRGRAGACLHAKALAVDGRSLFVGSYNVDPRSASLNCEQGVLLQNQQLTRQLEGLFDRQCDSSLAWKVSLQDGRLRWTDDTETVHQDPDASFSRHFRAWIARVLRLDAQL